MQRLIDKWEDLEKNIPEYYGGESLGCAECLRQCISDLKQELERVNGEIDADMKKSYDEYKKFTGVYDNREDYYDGEYDGLEKAKQILCSEKQGEGNGD